MSEDSKPFRLLDLPAEIRILILRQIVGYGFISLGFCSRGKPVGPHGWAQTQPYIYIESITNKPNIHCQDIRCQVYQNFDKYDQVATVENPEKTLNILKTCHSLHDEGSPELFNQYLRLPSSQGLSLLPCEENPKSAVSLGGQLHKT